MRDKHYYPVSRRLAHRLLLYLNVFRFSIGILLLVTLFSPVFSGAVNVAHPLVAKVTLGIYLAFSLSYLFEWRRAGRAPYSLANLTLATDLAAGILLLFSLGGLTSGVGLLLVFASASAGLLLERRRAMLIAAIGTIAILAEYVYHGLYLGYEARSASEAGLYGLSCFFASMSGIFLARWNRSFEMLAIQQSVDLADLEQINETVIRRMRTGVIVMDATCIIRLMNESAWFLLGSPGPDEHELSNISPELESYIRLWKADQDLGDESLVLRASQARVIPRISELPGTPSAGYLIFLEDTGIVSRRANAMTIESLAELSSSIAHEIRNPLAALKNAAELLAESSDISVGDKRLTEIINAQSMRMNDIVENILQLARREQSRPDRFEINQWLRGFTKELNDSHLGHKLQLILDLSRSPVHIWFDRSQMHQVIWKLLENAAVHAVVHDIPPKVTVQVVSLGSSPHCVLDVSDNGPGIHQDNLDRIFEPFFSTHAKGSGLGLYIAKQLCEANLSELTVDSVPGRGTRFRLRIPTVQAQSLAQSLEPLLDANELEGHRS